MAATRATGAARIAVASATRRGTAVPPYARPLWRCPKCGKWFVTRNIFHSCAHYSLAHHFRGKPRARALFEHFRRALEAFGPVRLVSNKTKVGFMVRVRFAGVTYVRGDSLRCGMWLTRRVASKHWVKVDRYAPRAYIYQFELRKPGDLNPEIRRFLRESYAVGCQRHLMRRRSSGRSPPAAVGAARAVARRRRGPGIGSSLM